MDCPDCGYHFCKDFSCGQCIELHAEIHGFWFSSRYLPDYQQWPMSTTEVSSHRVSSKARRCPSCEEPVAVTDHVCKAVDKSEDWLDVMQKLK